MALHYIRRAFQGLAAKPKWPVAHVVVLDPPAIWPALRLGGPKLLPGMPLLVLGFAGHELQTGRIERWRQRGLHDHLSHLLTRPILLVEQWRQRVDARDSRAPKALARLGTEEELVEDPVQLDELAVRCLGLRAQAEGCILDAADAAKRTVIGHVVGCLAVAEAIFGLGVAVVSKGTQHKPFSPVELDLCEEIGHEVSPRVVLGYETLDLGPFGAVLGHVEDTDTEAEHIVGVAAFIDEAEAFDLAPKWIIVPRCDTVADLHPAHSSKRLR